MASLAAAAEVVVARLALTRLLLMPPPMPIFSRAMSIHPRLLACPQPTCSPMARKAPSTVNPKLLLGLAPSCEGVKSKGSPLMPHAAPV